MKVTLVFPPQCDPRAPYLAVPTLAAYLRQHAIPVTAIDVNVLAYEHFLGDGFVASTFVWLAGEILRLENQDGLSPDDQLKLAKLRYYWERRGLLRRQLPEARAVIHNRDTFYDKEHHTWAWRVIDEVLTLSSARYWPSCLGLRDYLMPLNRYISSELLTAVRDSRNLFLPFFERFILPRIEETQAELCGISITNPQQLIPGFTLARLLKQRGTFTVIGGGYLTRLRDRLPDCLFDLTDAIIVYDGEEPLHQLIRAREQGAALGGIPNLLYREKITVRQPSHLLLADLTDGPAPDFTGLPLEKYFSPEVVLPYDPARGCYWGRCRFCDIPYSSRLPDNQYRTRLPARVAEDLHALQEAYRTDNFIFTTESLHPEFLAELSRELLAREIHCTWLCYARMEPGFTPETLALLRQAGCCKLLAGMETAAPRLLANMAKGITVVQAQQFIDACRAAAMPLHLFLICGFPGETEKDVAATTTWLERNRDFLGNPENSIDITRYVYTRNSIVGRDPGSFGSRNCEATTRDLSIAYDAQLDDGPSIAELDERFYQFSDTLNRMFPDRFFPFGEEHALLFNKHRTG